MFGKEIWTVTYIMKLMIMLVLLSKQHESVRMQNTNFIDHEQLITVTIPEFH
jgi:hypothetical protein